IFFFTSSYINPPPFFDKTGFLEVSRNKRSLSPTTQGSHIPVGAGSTAYILLHQQLYKPAPVFLKKPRFQKQAIAFPNLA
ncbi:MAG: hypothetical protein P5693_18420, partial [Limnospira sp. PMC 1290.21]|uniref:hypothetical protein n=1 Tax=unclassified Limnospira TaxID=2642885 RepID=UPI0028E0E63D